MKIDLHSHSSASDGERSPERLVSLAKAASVDALAITDHDTMAGYLALTEATPSVEREGVRVVAGVEISCKHRLTGGYGRHSADEKSIHVVGLFIQDAQGMQSALRAIQENRALRGLNTAKKLAALLDLDWRVFWERVVQNAGGNPKAVGRAHLAQALVASGAVKTPQEAFDKYLADGKPAYVALAAPSMERAIALIHQSGGVAVLAHPTRYRLSATRARRLIADFALLGGDACELPAVCEPKSTRAMVDRAIAANGLLVSVGSDFHGSHLPWRKLGVVPPLAKGQRGVWEGRL